MQKRKDASASALLLQTTNERCDRSQTVVLSIGGISSLRGDSLLGRVSSCDRNQSVVYCFFKLGESLNGHRDQQSGKWEWEWQTSCCSWATPAWSAEECRSRYSQIACESARESDGAAR